LGRGKLKMESIPVQMGKGGDTSIVAFIKKPIGVVLMLVVVLILAGITAVSTISGQLTAAVVSAAGLIVLVLILFIIELV